MDKKTRKEKEFDEFDAKTAKAFGSWLRQQRESLEWSQNDLARRIGCNGSLVGQWEIAHKGDRKRHQRPSQKMMFRIAEVLGVDAAVVFRVAGFDNPNASLADLAPNSPPDKKTALVKMARVLTAAADGLEDEQDIEVAHNMLVAVDRQIDELRRRRDDATKAAAKESADASKVKKKK